LIAYKQALDLNPKYSLAWANLCGLLSQVQAYDVALAACDLALLHDSYWGSDGEALAWDNRGNILFYLGDYQESLESFNKALAVNPGYSNANNNRSIVLSHLKHFVPEQDE
ncbi:MAG: tetratricopeptide repeat protein, partial [Cyanobacteria bacterium P01_F01_bin.143]